jgi:hypothetical protein
MDDTTFWNVIEKGFPSSGTENEWRQRLQHELEKLAPDEIIEWNHYFDRLAARAYTCELWNAAYLINGGASDDGFYYFRCWLIGMGKQVYEAAVANPDSLANVVVPGVDAEAEIYAVAHYAWISVTGKSYDDPYPARNEDAELTGEDWDADDPVENRKHLPRLSALFDE